MYILTHSKLGMQRQKVSELQARDQVFTQLSQVHLNMINEKYTSYFSLRLVQLDSTTWNTFRFG